MAVDGARLEIAEAALKPVIGAVAQTIAAAGQVGEPADLGDGFRCPAACDTSAGAFLDRHRTALGGFQPAVESTPYISARCFHRAHCVGEIALEGGLIDKCDAALPALVLGDRLDLIKDPKADAQHPCGMSQGHGYVIDGAA